MSAATLLAPSTGLAQSVDIGGHGAFHFPVGSLVEGPPIEKRLLAGLMVGVDAVVWMTGRLGFAGKVAYGPTRVAVIQARNVVDRDASVILASARVLFALTPLMTGAGVIPPWSFYIGAGAGLASRSGGVWSYASGRTSPALVLNAGLQTPAGPQAVMRIELEDYISRVQFDAGMPSETAAQTHHDLVLSLALSYRVRP